MNSELSLPFNTLVPPMQMIAFDNGASAWNLRMTH